MTWKLISAVCTLCVCGWVALTLLGGICTQPGSYAVTTNDADGDRKVKATVFTTDCGAMTATRTLVKFSNAYVNGRLFGDTILVLRDIDCNTVHTEWKGNRDFL